MTGVSFVVPVLDGEPWLERVLEAILAEGQRAAMPFEVLVIDDGSRDRSAMIADDFAARGAVELIAGEGRGAAAAINRGISAARFGLLAQVDQDVILLPGWLQALVAALEEPQVAAAQGVYRADRSASIWARISGYDLELRYARLDPHSVDHVCTGNSLYRTRVLREVGQLDESLGYGYDNDLSYRLLEAGHRLVLVPDAGSLHQWPQGAAAFVRQQYGLGYGRLDLVAKHPRRVRGDAVSGPGMILHVPVMLAGLAALVAAVVLLGVGEPWRITATAAAILLLAPALERLVAAIRAAARFRDPAALAMVGAHLLRDVVWVGALLAWSWRRIRGRGPSPRQSMGRR